MLNLQKVFPFEIILSLGSVYHQFNKIVDIFVWIKEPCVYFQYLGNVYFDEFSNIIYEDLILC